MTSTPPLQIVATPDTPLTPLHGAAYDRPRRRSTRSSTRTTSVAAGSPSTPQAPPRDRAVKTPRNARRTTATLPAGIHSPRTTPLPPRTTQRVQILSPSSPGTQPLASKQAARPESHLQPLLSSSTTLSEGMLPTPVKTPRKKMAPSVPTAAARALFQDPALHHDTALVDPIARRGKKQRRYNGFSLENYAADGDDGIQIYTDSRDAIPKLDKSKSNPFVEHAESDESSARKIAGTSKRRRVSGRKKMDSQVKEAIDKDEGMVYVFRGKKIYRRFDDADDDEDESLDGDELGLLEHTPQGSDDKPLKTLTRKSIKPRLLFQSEEQQRARELEKEEEALTDIEAPEDGHSADELDESQSVTGRPVRSGSKAPAAVVRSRPTKKASPFDSWPRVKKGLRSAEATPKGKKRTANEAVDEPVEAARVVSKKTRS